MFYWVVRGRNCAEYLPTCIRSIKNQTLEDWRVILILDAPKDNSFEVAKKLIGDDERFFLKCNTTRKGLGKNLWRGIKYTNAEDEDIICILDGDDWSGLKALRVVERAYEKNPKALLTYGSYVCTSNGRKGANCKPYSKGTKIRNARWQASHLKTFKYKLFRYVPSEYLQHNGKWAEAASDVGLMFALMELAGMKRCVHIPRVIYHWRNAYKHSTNRALQRHWKRIFRAKKPLKRVKI